VDERSWPGPQYECVTPLQIQGCLIHSTFFTPKINVQNCYPELLIWQKDTSLPHKLPSIYRGHSLDMYTKGHSGLLSNNAVTVINIRNQWLLCGLVLSKIAAQGRH